MFDLATFIRAAQTLGPVLVKVPAVTALLERARRALAPDDQEEAKGALADIIADNDEGHRRLQEKLQAASER